jgi:hypothetical protein
MSIHYVSFLVQNLRETMHRSLSSFLRSVTDAHFEGPIPAAERERIRIVEGAERAFDRSLSPLERAVRSLSIAYADVLKDSASSATSGGAGRKRILAVRGGAPGRGAGARGNGLGSKRQGKLGRPGY